jgi:hypothetical protein
VIRKDGGQTMGEPVHGPTGAGSVVLDLGGAIGALVVETPAALSGREIEISLVAAATAATSAAAASAAAASAAATSAAGGRTHSLVRERRTAAGTSYAAVYPDLPAGQYLIWRRMDTPVGEVTIDGGVVTRFRWPD